MKGVYVHIEYTLGSLFTQKAHFILLIRSKVIKVLSASVPNRVRRYIPMQFYRGFNFKNFVSIFKFVVLFFRFNFIPLRSDSLPIL